MTVINNLEKFVSKDQVHKWLNEINEKMVNDVSPDKIWSWLENIQKQHTPRIVGYTPCTKLYTHYIADPMHLPKVGSLLKCDVCTK